MDGKDAIIEKILTNAKAQADGLVTEASEYANRIVADATAQGKRAVGEAQKQAEIACNEHISRRLTVCELDIKKIKLSAKKQVLDEVFARAGESVSQLKPDDYKRVILGMLDESAEDGDIITVAKSDEKVITSAFIADYAKKRGIKLSLDSAFGDFKGGFILHGRGVDKNMTFAVELKSLRDELESKVASMLFDEVK